MNRVVVVIFVSILKKFHKISERFHTVSWELDFYLTLCEARLIGKTLFPLPKFHKNKIDYKMLLVEIV